MATKHHPEHHSELRVESPMDYAQHEATYNGFITGTKWTVIALVVLLVVLFVVVRP